MNSRERSIFDRVEKLKNMGYLVVVEPVLKKEKGRLIRTGTYGRVAINYMGYILDRNTMDVVSYRFERDVCEDAYLVALEVGEYMAYV